MTRRDLLFTGLAGVAPHAARGRTIFIEMAGGPSQADMFDLQPGPWMPSWMRPIRNRGVLFPAGLMPNLAEMLDRIVLVRGLRARSLDHHSPVPAGAGPTLRATAGSFGDACDRSLLLLDRGARFVHIRLGNWDHHGNLYELLRPIGASFDAGITRLLRAAGGNVRIVAMGEFGRWPGPLNQNGGRDHYPLHAALIGGTS